VTKIVIDAKNGNNLLYLPLDKLMQSQQAASGAGTATPVPAVPDPAQSGVLGDARSRDGQRSRDRDVR
jgi:membrane protease subunit HflK